MHDQFKEMDTKELDLPDTVYARDIDNSVFRAISAKVVSLVEGVAFVEGNLLDSLLGREGADHVKGISIDQDQKNHSVNIKIELNVAYGISIPEKAEEIQEKVTAEVTKLTGLHVGCVHVLFRNLIPEFIEAEETKEEVIPEIQDEEFAEDAAT